MSNNNEIPYRQEILRKGIHLCSLSIPIVGSMLSKETMLYIMVPITVFTVLLDLLSKKIEFFRKILHWAVGNMLRPHETTKELMLNGASWVFLSALMCIAIFPKIIFVSAFSILIISDISAALYGRKFGKRKFLDKSLEGSLAFFITALIVIFTIGQLSSAPLSFYVFGSLGGLFAAIVEAASKRLRLDDNLSIPLAVGLIMLIGSFISSALGNPFINIL